MDVNQQITYNLNTISKDLTYLSDKLKDTSAFINHFSNLKSTKHKESNYNNSINLKIKDISEEKNHKNEKIND